MPRFVGLALIAVGSLAQAALPVQPDAPVTCANCAAWNQRRAPFRVFGNTYYVGVAGLSSVLVTSEDGLILLDAALPQSAAIVVDNIRALGFDARKIRLILNSHAHYDHAGGIAAIQRATGAIVAASPAAVQALEQGMPGTDDPLAAFGEANRFPAVGGPTRRVQDGESMRVGSLAVTAHHTPGHTTGGTTWTWRSCDGGQCLDVVYADSLNAVSAPGFRFTGSGTAPGRMDAFRQSIKRVESLPCDVLLSVHPEFVELPKKLALFVKQPDVNPFIHSAACRDYARAAERALARRIATER